MPSPEFLDAIDRLVKKIERSLGPVKEPVRMYIAGGAAVHFYTSVRVTDDVDATFSTCIDQTN
ncbi:MAG: hypothetical protein MO847_02225 [Candidatus Protistobacter heckmanni]|nr:hypothetical protein [Candidatus Protistobacter heckmanni]